MYQNLKFYLQIIDIVDHIIPQNNTRQKNEISVIMSV